MNFDNPTLDWEAPELYEEFMRFKQHSNFIFKGPLSKSSKKDKSGWIGMWIGQQGREVYKTLTWADGEEDDPDAILDKIETYVKPRKNKRISRFKLRERKQKECETFDNFVKDLKLILMDCDYGDQEDILIDTIIAGVYHRKIQERLLDQGQQLTLAKTLEIGRQFEISQQQLAVIRGEDTTSVSAVKSQGFRQKHDRKSVKKTHPEKICDKCGFDISRSHRDGKCPAQGTVCNYCKKPNHWIQMCRKRKQQISSLQEQSSEEYEDDLLTIYSLQSNNNRSDKWIETLNIDNKPVTFRIDTGAKCNIIVKSDYERLNLDPNLTKTSRVLRSYSNHKIRPEGAVNLDVSHKDTTKLVHFLIVDIDQENVISGDTSELLGLVARISLTTDSEKTMKQLNEFPELIKTTGTLPGEYSIKIDPNAKGTIHAPRRQPAALRPKIVQKLKDMEENDYITKVEEPTEWVSSMVVSVRNDKVRICIDPKDLNQAILREHHPLKTVEEVVSNIPGCTVFSTLDAKSGFLQIKLDSKSSFLTTFNTPIGRYRWLRLPFGIKSAPEIYQRIMDQMLEGIDGAAAIMDDILIAGVDMAHHDEILKKVVDRATQYNLKLNFEKCSIRKQEVRYVGHIVSSDGIKPDPLKVQAVTQMPAPTDKDGIRRFLGLIQYLSKFLPDLSEVDQPLRSLLKSDIPFHWDHEQRDSFNKLKLMCSSPPVLALFDVDKPVEIQCDASKSGLGAVLVQDGRPIAFTSRSLTDTEQRYAQIEKEMLSIVHAATKFHCYIFGKETTVFNDHKPLEVICKKPLLSAPMRLQRMLLKVQAYDLVVKYRRGSEMLVADALSRAYLTQDTNDPDSSEFENVSVIEMISVTPDRYSEIRRLTQNELQSLSETILHGWPDDRKSVPISVRPYWDSRDQLSVSDCIIFKGPRIVIPPTLRRYMISIIHESHLGMVKCKQRAREVMFWPGMNDDIESAIRDCTKCAEYYNKQRSEPLKPTPPPDLPYQMVGSDIFEFGNHKYLVLVDYYSKYIDAVQLKSLTASATIDAMKSVFSCHGIPSKLRTDNGRQFDSAEFKSFCKTYGIQHETSSPYFQSSNGEAERAIQTIKNLWRKSEDKHLSLLDYRTTPLEGINLSPAQLLMSRRPRNTLPASQKVLIPKPYNRQDVKQHFELQKSKQKFYYDAKKSAKPLEELTAGDNVRLAPTDNKKSWQPAVVRSKHEKPRSYNVATDDTVYRRNRKFLRKVTKKANQVPQQKMSPADQPPHYSETASHQHEAKFTTRSGRCVNPPKRLDM